MQDHPLSTQNNSTWKKFYEDKQIWEEIEKDVKRTRIEMAFFYMALDRTRISSEDFDRLEMQAHTKKSDLSREDIANYIESHSDALARVLFIYAQLNKGIRYVQGMNEVIAILYYCFYKFGNESVISTDYLESDLFFCFSNLMQELKDGFLRELDKEDSGL
jgi:TBC1 domain family member 13